MKTIWNIIILLIRVVALIIGAFVILVCIIPFSILFILIWISFGIYAYVSPIRREELTDIIHKKYYNG